ncbi:MAG: potassium/proton antiporter [Burkholderiales bacterium]
MSSANHIIFFGAALLLIAIIASAFSARVGAPLLLVFLVIGMLAGEDGPGGVDFDDFRLANLAGSLALAVILFDGGLRTRAELFRVGLRPALSLATVGVVITGALLGAFAAWVLGIQWMQGLLIGAIVASTDAAAVFSLLHAHGIALKQRVSATLEIESGSNDPMAVFLTIALVELLASGRTELDWHIIETFVLQMGIGACAGWAGGQALAWLLNRLTLPPALYPLLAAGGGVFIFGAVALADGSGFLAIYLAGVVIGNRQVQGQENILRVHDGLAWLSQIGMFLMLGLLADPAGLASVAVPSLAIALFLIFIARPLAVLASLAPFHFPWREQVFISWVGLRGAVPIILATFPLLAGVAQAGLFFHVAFVVVLVSLMVQGWTIGLAAKWLQLEVPPTPEPAQKVDLDVAGRFNLELSGYSLKPGSPALGLPLSELALPEESQIAGIVRGGRLTRLALEAPLQAGDYVYMLSERDALDTLGRVLTGTQAPARLEEHEFFGEFVLNGDARLTDLAEVYGIELPPAMETMTAADLLDRRFAHRPVVGDRLRLGRLELVAMEIKAGRVAKVGLNLHH